MSGFDYDVIVVGSGFGGSVAALRATEKGYRVGVMEAGRRWLDEDIPTTSWDVRKFLWQPELGMYGIQKMAVLDDVLILSGAGVGGGSHVYGNTLFVPPKQFFEAPEWSHITDWSEELAPAVDQASRMLGVERVPYMLTDFDRNMKAVAEDMGVGHSFNRAPVGVYFGSPGEEVEDPYFGGVGPRRTGCINCGDCMIGCGRNAKNKLTVNYLYLAEKFGARVHELHEVHEVVPLEGGGFEVRARHPGWMQRAFKRDRHVYTAEQVIVAAHAYGSAKLLHHMQYDGTLPGLSTELGRRARTNSEQLLSVTIPYEDWKRDPERVHITPGSVSITSGVWPDPYTSIEPVYYGRGSNLMAFMFTFHQQGAQDHPTREWLKKLVTSPGEVLKFDDPRHWSERMAVMLCMQTSDTSIDLFWKNGMLRSKPGPGTPPAAHIPVVEEYVDRLATRMGADQGALAFEVLDRTASAHFIGGMSIAESPDDGVVDPYQRVFGHPGLHVMDGSVMPANPGVNPSLLITALAERAMSLWPDKGEPDPRPPLGSGYERIAPVLPRRPIVPAGVPGELRLDARAADIIPEYPY
ncbi:GMC oxidoreductase [Nocardioides insulae]|uniref:GMC oxidoreductase n=1 Tax=Nocardioides insulae TaxID=394734 RepID=UPI0004227EAB|nr:GMC family oxidoreductase [Nocardioides insulae]